MSDQLTGKIALITGGNSGIGLETAKTFVQKGATVIITGRNQDTLDKAVAEIGSSGEAIQGDVSNNSDLDRLYDQIKTKYGRLDILFANAGIALAAPVNDVTEEMYDQIFDINVKGLFFTVQKALPLFSDGGSIILNASVLGKKGVNGMSVYGGAKAAVRSFARTWASELSERKIRVNTISPGPIETPIYGKLGLTEQEVEEWGASLLTEIPLARFGQPREVADAALFLASNASSFTTGIDLTVDGGLSQI